MSASRVPHRVDRIQLRGVGLETDTALAASDVVAHCAVVVWSRHLVWMGLLPVHRLALADSRAPWVCHDPSSYIQLLVREIAGIDLTPARANALALGTLIVVGALTAFLNLRDLRRHTSIMRSTQTRSQIRTTPMRYGLLMRIGAVVFAIGTLPSAYAQTAAGSTRPWTPAAWRMGNPTSRACGTTKSRTSHLSSFPKSSPGDRRLRRRNCRPAQKRSPKQNRRRRLDRAGRCRVLCLYWFDWYWRKPLAGDWPALVVDPPTGRMPPLTPEARKTAAFMREHLHDAAETMEAGDRCVSRGVLGMMMPTAYNNGKLIVQTPGYVLIYSEMIHSTHHPARRPAAPQRQGRSVGGRPSRPLGRERARHRVDQFQGG